jgi:hypothetical protein
MDNEVRKRNVGDSVMSKEQVIDFKNVNFFFCCKPLSRSDDKFSKRRTRSQRIIRQQDEGIEVLKETLENMYATSNDIGREIDEQEG